MVLTASYSSLQALFTEHNGWNLIPIKKVLDEREEQYSQLMLPLYKTHSRQQPG